MIAYTQVVPTSATRLKQRSKNRMRIARYFVLGRCMTPSEKNIYSYCHRRTVFDWSAEAPTRYMLIHFCQWRGSKCVLPLRLSRLTWSRSRGSIFIGSSIRTASVDSSDCRLSSRYAIVSFCDLDVIQSHRSRLPTGVSRVLPMCQ